MASTEPSEELNQWVQLRSGTGEAAHGSDNVPGARSSHKISIISDTLYLFGGEKIARVPVDNDMWKLRLDSSTFSTGGWERCSAESASARM